MQQPPQPPNPYLLPPPRPPAQPQGGGKGGAFTALVLGLIATGVGGFAFYYATSRTRIDGEALLHGSIIGGVGLLLIGFALSKLINPAVGVLIPLGVVAGGFFLYHTASERQREYDAGIEAESAMYDAVLPVCTEGATVEGAADYEGGPGTHPIAVFTRYSDGDWLPSRNTLPEGWEPSSTSDARLVACVHSIENTVEMCPYNATGGRSFTINRTRYDAEYWIYEASTRRELAHDFIQGTEPAPCPAGASFGENEYSRQISGTYPAGAAIHEEFRSWVEGQ